MARGFRDEDVSDDDPFNEQPDNPAPRRGGFRSRRKTDEGVDIQDVEVIAETGAAILVRGKGLSSDPFGMNDEAEEGWFPISQLHERCEVRHKGDRGLLVISTWMAEKRGLR